MSRANAFVAKRGLVSQQDAYMEQILHMEGNAVVYQTLGSDTFAAGFTGNGAQLYKDANNQ